MEIQHLEKYYNNIDEDGRLLSKYGSVEFLTTMKYIQKYLTQDMKILDIGAGTGIYSLALADKCHQVDAVELIQKNIDIFKLKIEKHKNITVQKGNALDLSFLEDNFYDITLLFGPMYHLYTEEHKLKALSEAIRVTKPKGYILIAYCMSDATILNYGFVKKNIVDLIEKEMVDTEEFKPRSEPIDLFELHRKEDIDSLNNKFNVKRLNYVATDGFTNHLRETVNNMSDKEFEIYMKYHFFDSVQ